MEHPDVTPPTPLAAARWYQAQGWAPIPVPFRSKNPGRPGWQHQRLAADDLPAQFNGAPQNVGILLGMPSGGLADVDLDTPEAHRLAETFLPPTGCIFGRPSTPRAHRLFVVDGVLATERFRDPVAPAEDARAVLVELRFTGTQTLVPPSVHPGGEPIHWHCRDAPSIVPATDLRCAVARLGAAALLARHWPSIGTRQDAALALAGGLLHAGWDEDAATAFITAVAEAAGDDEVAARAATVRFTARAAAASRATTGWPRLADLVDDRIVDAARGWLGLRGGPQPPRHPRTLHAAPDSADRADSEDAPEAWDDPVPLPEGDRPPFPTRTLPAPLRAFVEALAQATQTPPALAALLVLAAVATAAAKRVAVVVRPGWREPVNLYTLIALGSGNRKSAVLKAVAAPLVAYERAEANRLLPEVAVAETRRAIAEKALDKARTRAASAEGDEYWRQREEAERLAKDLVASADLRVPTPPRLLVDDVTPEKLAALMADHGGRMAVLSAEGGLFEIMAGRFFKDGRSPNLDLFLKAHAGDDLPIDRLGRPSSHLTAPALTLGLAVQGHVLRALASRPAFRGTGLLARYVYGVPASFVGRRQIAPDPVPEATADAYAAAIAAILALTPLTEADGSPQPRDLQLSELAEAALRRFETALEPRLGPEGDLGHMADWGAKLTGLVARLSGLFHTVERAVAGERPWEQEIEGDTVEAAMAVAETFVVPHALTAFGEMGADPAMEDARLVLRALARWDGPEVSRRDLHQRSLKRRFARPDDLDRPLALLVAHGYLREVQPPERVDRRGRRPSDRYAINPLWRPHNLQNPHNAAAELHSADYADCADGSGACDGSMGHGEAGW